MSYVPPSLFPRHKTHWGSCEFLNFSLLSVSPILLTPPAADKDQCIAALTLCSSGRWKKIPCSCTLLACIISLEPSGIQCPLTHLCVSKCVFYPPLLCQVICHDSVPLAGHSGSPLMPNTHTKCQCWIILSTDRAIGRQKGI